MVSLYWSTLLNILWLWRVHAEVFVLSFGVVSLFKTTPNSCASKRHNIRSFPRCCSCIRDLNMHPDSMPREDNRAQRTVCRCIAHAHCLNFAPLLGVLPPKKYRASFRSTCGTGGFQYNTDGDQQFSGSAFQYKFIHSVARGVRCTHRSSIASAIVIRSISFISHLSQSSFVDSCPLDIVFGHVRMCPCVRLTYVQCKWSLPSKRAPPNSR